MNVIKRDGRVEEFDRCKIAKAILKASKACGKPLHDGAIELLAIQVTMGCHEDMNIEEIQDRVENILMREYPEVAKQYILYREQRNKARGRKKYQLYEDIIGVKPNEVTRENANMNADTPAGMMMKFASETSKEFVDNCVLTGDIKEYVRRNIIHIHDKDYYPTKSLTCIQHPLDKVLNEGFRAGHGAHRPAKRIESAAFMACISLEDVQNCMHGGQAIPAFDFYLAPFVRKTYEEEVHKLEELHGKSLKNILTNSITEYEVKPLDYSLSEDEFLQRTAINATVQRVHQAMEAFIHNMNGIHSRGGNQVVFSSINYGTDTSPEGRCVIRELLTSTYEGVGHGETPIFPIQIWKLKAGVSADPGDPNYDLFQLACKVTAKRFFPNFVNLDAPFNEHSKWKADDPERYKWEVAEMGCRTRVFENRHGEKTSIGRGNLSFTTINLVRLALENKYVSDFIVAINDAVGVACKQLYERYHFQKTAKKKQFPLLMSGLWKGSENLNPEDEVGDVLKQGTLAVGFIGLAEALTYLFGKHHGESIQSRAFGLSTVSYMRDMVAIQASKYDLNISLFATPAESLCGRFIKKDREDFGVIKGVTDKEYYTNSFHVPVWYKCGVEEKIAIEAPYHAMTPAGHITYVELDGDLAKNVQAIEDVVRIMRKHDIGYGAINHTRSRCIDCGYENADKDLTVCPSCGSDNIDIIQRITGYLVGSMNRWNDAKKAEVKDRVKHE